MHCYALEDVDVQLLSYNSRHIDVHIQGGPFGARWRGTFVYGYTKASERHHMWTMLRRIKDNSSEPWMVLGDFNEAMWQAEHFSRAKRSERLMMDFREVLSHLNTQSTANTVLYIFYKQTSFSTLYV